VGLQTLSFRRAMRHPFVEPNFEADLWGIRLLRLTGSSPKLVRFQTASHASQSTALKFRFAKTRFVTSLVPT
jgi:hypothetical protein